AGRPLNRRLTDWWTLDFPAFRAEVKKALKREIPVRERDEWEAWLSDQRAEHETLTREIIEREMELDERVYALFDLTAEEIRVVEQSTKYGYGEV
ncbi:MAG: hypothetical protein ACR2H9_03450, partial [Longimicrobiaceae bacterium]